MHNWARKGGNSLFPLYLVCFCFSSSTKTSFTEVLKVNGDIFEAEGFLRYLFFHRNTTGETRRWSYLLSSGKMYMWNIKNKAIVYTTRDTIW